MKTEKALPNMLVGWVCRQYKRRGGKLCGPYWYRFWREGGRIRKAYVRPEQLEDVRAGCMRWLAFKRQVRAARQGVRDGVACLRAVRAELSTINGA